MTESESVSLSPVTKKKSQILSSAIPFNQNYPKNPYKTLLRPVDVNDVTKGVNIFVKNPGNGKEINMNMSLSQYRALPDNEKLVIHDCRIRAIRQRWCPVSMVNKDGTLHNGYFDSKPMALEWTDLEKTILLKGIFEFGLATIDSWNNIIRFWLPQRTPIEIKLEITRLIGRQNLNVYKGVEFKNELQIERERSNNKKKGKEEDKWFYGAYMDLMTDDMLEEARKDRRQRKEAKLKKQKLKQRKQNKNKNKNNNDENMDTGNDNENENENENEASCEDDNGNENENENKRKKSGKKQRTLDGGTTTDEAMLNKSKVRSKNVKPKSSGKNKKNGKIQTKIANGNDDNDNDNENETDNETNDNENKKSKNSKVKSSKKKKTSNQPKINALMKKMTISKSGKNSKKKNDDDNNNSNESDCKDFDNNSNDNEDANNNKNAQNEDEDDDIELID